MPEGSDHDHAPDEGDDPAVDRVGGPTSPTPATRLGGPASAWPLVLTALVVAALAASPWIADAVGFGYLLGTLTRVVILALAAVALDLVVGYGGLVSLGHALFLGTGAYTTGILLVHASRGAGWATDQALVAWPAAMLVGALLGWGFGALALRTRGVYFIMVTLAFNQMMFFLFSALEPYGGDDGIRMAERNRFGPWSLGDDLAFFYLCLALLVVGLVVANVVVRSPSGWILRGARDDDPRMQAVGARTRRHQLATFTISAAVVSLAGALALNESQFLSPDLAHWTQSGELLVMVIVGGVGSLVGGVLGAIALLLLEEFALGFTDNWQFYVGLGLVAIVLVAPRGLAGAMLGRHRNA